MHEGRFGGTPAPNEGEFERLCAELARQGPWLCAAAHPDDETIGASWLLSRAHAPLVLHLTDGAPEDPALRARSFQGTRAQYAALREGESERALALLEHAHLRRRSLGIADQRLCEELVPAVHALLSLLRELEPALVICHAYEGGHPDHDASAFVVRAALALHAREGRGRPALWEMTSYHTLDGVLRTNRFLPGQGAEWRVVLDERARRIKHAMLGAYASQDDVLCAFGSVEERYRRAPAVDFAEPPHRGALHYERLGWSTSGAHFRERVARAARELGLERGRSS
jgi:LmbE family N-acetylglucosaminyl deacetylase